ncbi:MAG: alpha/beta hydrolase [Desulfobacterales bacterium]
MEESERVVRIPAESQHLEGNLSIPKGAKGIVVFAHGSGSSRHSPRNQSVAIELQNGGLATLLMDLLTEKEEAEDMRTGWFRFNIDLLAQRVVEAVDWILEREDTRLFNIGAFGSSTGAAAALMAAGKRPEKIQAVVSRGGRPDLAGEVLPMIASPTLLIVGEKDESVIRMNEEAAARMKTETKIEIIPDATHLFPEPGALEKVSQLARQWFERFLARP